jgi:hypothetical protein
MKNLRRANIGKRLLRKIERISKKKFDPQTSRTGNMQYRGAQAQQSLLLLAVGSAKEGMNRDDSPSTICNP